MVQDTEIMTAVSRIRQRSEKHEEVEKLIGTFVDVGILPSLDNQNDQILYGRRGTGKTHVFRVLTELLNQRSDSVAIYIDARTLGSTSQFTDSSLPTGQRCLALFKDILVEIYNGLLEYIVDADLMPDQSEKAMRILDDLVVCATEPKARTVEVASTKTQVKSSDNRIGGRVNLSASPGGGIGGEASSKTLESEEVSANFTTKTEDKVFFPDLHHNLTDVLKTAGVKLYLLIDEWSSLPLDIQPYLAEFLKRGVLPVQRAVVKIASLEYRSQFALGDIKHHVGFELGADIATAPELDDYYVFDRNPEQIANLYADIVHRHLTSGVSHK